MKKFLKHFSLIMAIVLLVGMLSVFAIPTAAASGSTYSSNPTIAARIDKVLSTYGPNSFFTKNGKACSCHATSSIDCVSSPSSCNCLRKVTVDGKTVDLLAVQCFGYARYWQQVLFGAFENNTSKFQKLSGVSGTLTASNTKTWFTNNKASLHPGTHIRCYNSGHSIVLLAVDYNQGKVTYIQSNWVNQSTNNGTWCKVSAITTKTWSEFASTFSTLDYAQVYKNYYTEFPDKVTPPLATDFNATIKDGIYSLKIAHTSGKMLNVDSGDGTFGNGTLVNTYDRDGSITQKFYFKHESNGKYRIYAVCSGANGSVYNQAVDVNIGYGSSDVLNVGDSFDIWEVDSKWDNCQLFYIVPMGEGKYVIELASIPQAVLGAKSSDSASTNGGAITLQNYTSSTTQQWYFYNESGSAPVDPTINGSLTYTINYSASGATNVPSSQSKIHGNSMNISSTIPTKNGYSFLGWSTSNDNTVEYQAGATYTANASVTLYAVWSASHYSVAYNANGGTNAPAVQTKVHDTALTLSSTIPTKNGYSFVGWSTSNDSTVEYQAGATYTANANVTLYAVWKANEYSVNYDANGGTNAPSAQIKVHDSALTLSSNIPTKNGYSFVGWSTSNDSTVEYQAGATYTANSSVTLYAVWSAIDYSVAYNANGGTNAPSAQTKLHDTALTLSSTIPTKNGYSFVGWSTSNDSTVEYQAGATYTANSSVTLYAVWSAIDYSVAYNANGGTNAPSAQTKVHDTALTLSSIIPTKTGYTFKGWTIDANSNAVVYQVGDTYTNNESVTLYAVWEQNVIVDDNNKDDVIVDETTSDKDVVVDKETTVGEETAKNETVKESGKDEGEVSAEKSGCGSSIALSALSIAGCMGVAFICKKKKED